MLLLSRRKDQAIYIGDVRVLVLKIERGTVLLGIEAPKGVLVLREELR